MRDSYPEDAIGNALRSAESLEANYRDSCRVVTGHVVAWLDKLISQAGRGRKAKTAIHNVAKRRREGIGKRDEGNSPRRLR